MEFRRALSHIKQTSALVFNSIHVKVSKIHIYNLYNQKPIICNESPQIYLCFLTINHCIYEHKQLRFRKIIHLIFIVIIVVCYFSLFIIILRITWYGAIQLLVLLTFALYTLLMVIIYEHDYINIKHCNEDSRLVCGENLFIYVVLSMLEIAYIGFDILNRQVSIHALHQNFEYRARQAGHIASSEDLTLITKQNSAPAESFETVEQEFIRELI
ncbi:unnamed protein product [Rotaria sordida]|uniref:Uncharacterized protein n=1 Tax=Rotaria sordida TaxID=392033 RepID=A0A819H8N8_9BILA|nr:unnamed protein product [Rotaria sordida]CAF3893603.1 unnamed protein product [Rotaria sordida]